MAAPDNKLAVRSYFEDFMNGGDLDRADDLLSTNIAFHYPLGELRGIEALKHYIAEVRSAFPDLHFTIEDILGEGDLVACRWTLIGTRSGAFRGQAPTGRSVEVPGNTIFRMAGGPIAEIWVAFNPALLG